VSIDHLLLTPPAYACTWLEPIALLGALAGVTRTLRLGTMVLVLPLRNPVSFAKEWATLDLLSRGRSILGIGVGWHAEEFALMGVPYRERGARMNEAIELLKALWAGDHVTYEGRYYRVRDLTLDPKPVQRPHPPIWIGGGSQPFEKVYGQTVTNIDPVLRRIAKYADTWVPHSSATPAMVKGDSDVTRRRSGGCTRISSGCSDPASGPNRRFPTSRSSRAWTSSTGRRITCSAKPRSWRSGSAPESRRSTAAWTRSC